MYAHRLSASTLLSSVDNAVTLTVTALDANSNTIPSSFSVVLVLSGSATGAGPISLIDGVGTVQIRNTIPESVVASLSGVTNPGGSGISSSQTIVFASGLLSLVDFYDRAHDLCKKKFPNPFFFCCCFCRIDLT